MRITGGKCGGRVFEAPAGKATRPTSDRVRAALFNILQHHEWGDAIGDPLTNQITLDAFCGSGSLAFESLSRGAARAYLFDTDHPAFHQAKTNAAKLGLVDQCHFLSCDAAHPHEAKEPCSLIFLDPPYRKGLIPLALHGLEAKGWIAKNPLIIAETAKNEALELPETYKVLLERAYGDTAIRFLTRA